MNDFWNERFSDEKYAYGTEPNEFFKNQLNKLPPGKILFPAEGEGRNAVYAATKGWDVTAFDPSIEGKRKAELLALEKDVTIDYRIENYEFIDFPKESFDCIVLIFAHIHPVKREEYHKKLMSFLKFGGNLILEGFSKNQLNNKTGGPRDINMLFSKNELESDFSSFSELEIIETDTILNEGVFHQGISSVIRVLGNK
ncbi:class I SAM-dependent methyltransferase [Draconibacterium sp.]|jgi:SAM-dependent methyltransferase